MNLEVIIYTLLTIFLLTMLVGGILFIGMLIGIGQPNKIPLKRKLIVFLTFPLIVLVIGYGLIFKLDEEKIN